MITNYHKAIEQLQAMFPKLEEKKITSTFIAHSNYYFSFFLTFLDGHLEEAIQALKIFQEHEIEEVNIPEEYDGSEETPESKIGQKTESMIQSFSLVDQDKSISNIYKEVSLTNKVMGKISDFIFINLSLGMEGNLPNKLDEFVPLIPLPELPKEVEIEYKPVDKVEEKPVEESKPVHHHRPKPKKAFSFISAGYGADFITDAIDPVPKVRRITSASQNVYVEPSNEEVENAPRKRKESFAKKVGSKFIYSRRRRLIFNRKPIKYI